MIATLFPWLVVASIWTLAIASWHVQKYPPKCGHLARMGWA